MASGDRRTSDRLTPHVMFTDPPLAHVGLSEGEAARRGIPVRVAKLPMLNVLRTQATDETVRMKKLSSQHSHYAFAVVQSGLTSVVAAVISSLPLAREGMFAWHWLTSWLLSWAVMLPVVLAAAPFIRQLVTYVSEKGAD